MQASILNRFLFDFAAGQMNLIHLCTKVITNEKVIKMIIEELKCDINYK
jgi:hypothetical protein